jgi:hypothetical protein
MTARRHFNWRRWSHRLAVLLGLLAYAAATFGFPVLARGKAGHDCGCPPARQKARACCCHPAAGCCGGAAPSCCATEDETEPEEGATVRWVAGVSALTCKGLSTLWLAGGAVLPPPQAVSWSPEEGALFWLAPMSEAAFRLALPWPLPPPRGLAG